MSVHNITNFDEFIKSTKTRKYVLADFYADWCGPCQAIKPVVHDLAKEYDKLFVTTINTDQNPDIAGTLKIKSLPTFILFYNGTAVKKILGADANALKEAVRELCSKP